MHLLLQGSPISFILLFLFSYVVGVCLLFIFSFQRKFKQALSLGIFSEQRNLTIENLDLYTDTILYAEDMGMSSIDKHLQFLRLIINLAPLLGLLGTVMGIVKSTGGIVDQDQVELLAGISQSLITTAMGLVVSIPALLVHFFGKAQQEKLIIQVKQYILQEIQKR